MILIRVIALLLWYLTPSLEKIGAVDDDSIRERHLVESLGSGRRRARIGDGPRLREDDHPADYGSRSIGHPSVSAPVQATIPTRIFSRFIFLPDCVFNSESICVGSANRAPAHVRSRVRYTRVTRVRNGRERQE